MFSRSAGVRAIALCLPWRRGDRVVLLRGEFPANTTPWQQAALQYGLRLEWLDLADFDASNEAGLAALDEALRVGVRLVAVSAVQFKSGLQMPLAEMARRCHERGAELFVDAIQGFGATPISTTMGFDYLAAGGHKWLMGVEGAGLLYVRRERMSQLQQRHHFLPSMLGEIDSQRLLDTLAAPATPLETAFLSALHTEKPAISDECRGEYATLTGLLPRVAFGYTRLDVQHMDQVSITVARSTASATPATITTIQPSTGSGARMRQTASHAR